MAETAAEHPSGARYEKGQAIRRAKAARDDSVASESLTQAVLEAVLQLARLDLMVRTPRAGSVDIPTARRASTARRIPTSRSGLRRTQ